MTARAGRPLRFLALTLAGWVAVRIAMLWPDAAEVTGARIAPAVAAPHTTPTTGVSEFPADGPAPASRSRALALGATGDSRARSGIFDASPPQPWPVSRPSALSPPLESVLQDGSNRPLSAAPVQRDARSGRSSFHRWSGDLWVLARSGGGAEHGFGAPQLGGSQAGLRIAYALQPEGKLALAGRLTAPLHGRGREAAIGLEWRPFRLPVRLVAEGRVALDGTERAGVAVGAVGGFGPRPVGAGFALEAYGQAGVIDRGAPEGFVDGSARLARPLAAIGRVRLDLGGGLWGGAQRHAARLDVGPTLGLALPIGAASTRLSLDWRQRVAGDARPDSGLTLTLGADL